MATKLEVLDKEPTDLVLQVFKLKDCDQYSGFSELIKGFLDPVIKISGEGQHKSILDEIYVDGLDSSQVWEQSKLVIEKATEGLLFDEIPKFQSQISDSESDAENDKEVEEEHEEDEEDLEKITPGPEESVSKEEVLEDAVEETKNETESEEEEQTAGEVNKGKFGLNDNFFNLENFNKQILTHEERDDEVSESEEVDYFGDIPDDSEDDLDYYDDFFDKPSVKEETSSVKRQRKTKKVEEEEEEEEEEEFDDDEYDRAMSNTKLDLFEEPVKKAEDSNLSNFEKQQKEIQKQIAQLEQEAIGEKKWTMKGESSIKNRPQDSLLDEELEFDRNAKPAPIITQEVTETIEELIRRRIQHDEFDDLPRRLLSDALNNKFRVQNEFNIEEVGKKSQKSLAEIYEQENYQGISEDTVKNEELGQKHQEILELYQGLSYKLDALCSAHYIPKPQSKELEIKVNTSTIQMEDAQPLTMLSESALAPQELFKARNNVDGSTVTLANGLVKSKDELTKEEKKRLRQKRKSSSQNGQKKKKSKQDIVLDTLKKGNVQVIDSKGVKKDLQGNLIKDRQSKTVSFKL